MAEAAVAEGFTPEFGEGAAAQEQVPAELNLLHFLDRKDFVDCAVRLPAPAPGSEPKGEDEVVPGHRLALCSASGFFYRRLIVEAKDLTIAPVEGCGDLPAVDLPALPDDEELRRQVDVAGLFPLVLRFVYSGQLWESIEPQVTAENAMGLFALGELLEIRPLAARAFGFLETSVLTPETSARLLYAAARLARATPSSSSRGGGGSFDEPVARCTEVLRQGFEQVCSSPEDLDLLCRLPLDMLQPLLEADELEVLSEATVLEVARRLLRGRMRREEALVTLEGGRLSGAKAAGAPVGGVICEALVVEAPSPEVLLRARAEAPKYSAATDALQLQSGECELGKDLVLRIPKGAFGPGKPGTVAVRVRAAVSREVLLVGSLPSASLPLATAGEGAQTEVSLTTPDGNPGGTLRFKWKAEAAPPEVARRQSWPDLTRSRSQHHPLRVPKEREQTVAEMPWRRRRQLPKPLSPPLRRSSLQPSVRSRLPRSWRPYASRSWSTRTCWPPSRTPSCWRPGPSSGSWRPCPPGSTPTRARARRAPSGRSRAPPLSAAARARPLPPRQGWARAARRRRRCRAAASALWASGVPRRRRPPSAGPRRPRTPVPAPSEAPTAARRCGRGVQGGAWEALEQVGTRCSLAQSATRARLCCGSGTCVGLSNAPGIHLATMRCCSRAALWLRPWTGIVHLAPCA
mmetsp:Transcript_137536/g.439060  ORF Transcript_137536/g.439060 Transcript_137536/m.439060 type:complete len:689 (+) Transcript_137536:78-2144(+)